jgi:hypothetical protein
MGIALSNTEQEFCAECGEFVDQLNDFTGWCHSCSGTAPSVLVVYLWSGKRTLKASWFDANANAIERFLAEGVNFTMAVEAVLKGNRPICQCCGNGIKGVASTTRGTVLFCRKREQCHRMAVRYKYYRYQRRLQPIEALSKARKGMKRVIT